MKNLLLVIICCISFTACSKNDVPTATPSNIVSAPVTHIATMDEWKAALLSTYREDNFKDQGEGVTEFTACFQPDQAKKCSAFAFGERDGFRKLRFYKAGLPMNVMTNVKAYISIRDGKTPNLFLAPYYWGRNGWLFMKKLSIMVDDEVILERDFDGLNVDRTTKGVGVAEQYQFIATSEDLAALRKINESSKVFVRLTGDKGYVNLENGQNKKAINATSDFKHDIVSAIKIYDIINHAIGSHIVPDTADKISKG